MVGFLLRCAIVLERHEHDRCRSSLQSAVIVFTLLTRFCKSSQTAAALIQDDIITHLCHIIASIDTTHSIDSTVTSLWHDNVAGFMHVS